MGRVVLACKSDEEVTRAERGAAIPYSLLTDRSCFSSCTASASDLCTLIYSLAKRKTKECQKSTQVNLRNTDYLAIKKTSDDRRSSWHDKNDWYSATRSSSLYTVIKRKTNEYQKQTQLNFGKTDYPRKKERKKSSDGTSNKNIDVKYKHRYRKKISIILIQNIAPVQVF